MTNDGTTKRLYDHTAFTAAIGCQFVKGGLDAAELQLPFGGEVREPSGSIGANAVLILGESAARLALACLTGDEIESYRSVVKTAAVRYRKPGIGPLRARAAIDCPVPRSFGVFAPMVPRSLPRRSP